MLLVLIYGGVVFLGLVLEIYAIGQAADAIGLGLSLGLFLYAIINMRQNLKKLETTSVNEWFIVIHLINFGVYTVLWVTFEVLSYIDKMMNDKSETDLKIMYWSTIFSNL